MATLVDIAGAESQVSLADLAGINIDDVAEKEWKTFVEGNFDWEVQADSGLDTFVRENKDSGDNETVPVVKINCKCIHAHAVKGDGVTIEDALGEDHTENFLVRELEDLGRCKALMTNSGFTETIRGQSMTFQQALEKFVGWRFNSKIKHTAKKGDTDVKYANFRDVKPLAQG